jgi:transposase
MGTILTPEGRQTLLVRHRAERDGRVRDRIKAVLLRDDGLSYAEIARVLFLSDEGVRQQVEDYLQKNGKLQPENGGSQSRLSDEQAQKLIAHLETTLYVRTCDIAAYVFEIFGIKYSVRGLTKWLHQHGFTYHKPVGVPAKADGAAQEAWIAQYEKLKNSLSDNEKILFMDGVHPTHAVRFSCGWIKKGVRKEIPTNGSQKRLNILGALDLEDMAIHTQEYDAINAEAIIAFLGYLLTCLPGMVLHIVLDQAGYHTCAAVKEWAKANPRIRLRFLPTYSPNLNTIERVWKIMHEHTANNLYSPTFKAFTEKIRGFFKHTFPQNASLWVDRLTDNFTPRYSPLIANS